MESAGAFGNGSVLRSGSVVVDSTGERKGMGIGRVLGLAVLVGGLVQVVSSL